VAAAHTNAGDSKQCQNHAQALCPNTVSLKRWREERRRGIIREGAGKGVTKGDT